MENIRFEREYKTPMVWNVTISCDMSFKAENELEALMKASELGNDKAFLATLMAMNDEVGLKMAFAFKDNCLSELEEVC